MAIRNILSPHNQVSTAAGAPLSGGKVFLFEPGTTTFVSSFKDSGLVTPNTNPVRLSGSGRANIWVSRDVDMFITDRNSGDVVPTNIVISELRANPDSLGQDESGGLVPNGSFEIDIDANTIPDSWDLVSDAGSNNAIDTSESTDGAQSFRFTSGGTGGGSLTTSEFFPVNDTENLRVNVDLRSSVAGVRNIVRVEWYDVSQVLISNSDSYDSTNNPLTFTSQQLSVAPPAGARFAKLRLIGADPSVAVAGSTFFDRVQVFYPAIVSGVFDNLLLSGNQIESTNTNGDIIISPNGTGLTIINRPRALTDIVTATPPTNEAVTGGYSIGDADDTDLLADIGFAASSVLSIDNFMHGGGLRLRGQSDAGVSRDVLFGDPDGETALFYAGIGVVHAQDGGLRVNDNDGVAPNILLFDNAANQVAAVRHTGASFRVESNVDSAPLELIATDAGSVARTMIGADPDGEVTVRFGSDISLRTHAAGITVQDISGADPFLAFQATTGATRQAYMQTSGAGLELISEQHGLSVRVAAEDAGGTLRNILLADPDGDASLYEQGNERLVATSTGIIVRRDTNADDVDSRLRFQYLDGTDRGLLGYLGDASLVLRNEVHGANIALQAETGAGAIQNVLLGTPGGDTLLYHDGLQRVRAGANGALDLFGDANTDVDSRQLFFRYQNAAIRGLLGYSAGPDLELGNQVHGGRVVISAETSGGASRDGIEVDPDNAVSLLDPINSEINLRTQQRDAAGNASGAQVRGSDDVLRDVGYNTIPESAQNGAYTLSQDDIGKIITHTIAADHTYIVPTTANIPNNAAFTILNINGDVTIDAEGAIVLRYFDGAAWQDTAGGGTLSLLDGFVNLWKQGAALWYVWGAGFSAP